MPMGSPGPGSLLAGARQVNRSNGALPGLPPGRSEPLFQNAGRDLGRPLGFSRRIPVMPPPPRFFDGLSDLLGLERQPSPLRSPAPSLPTSADGLPDTPASRNTQLAESPVADKPFERIDGKLDRAAVLNPGPPTTKPVDEFDMYRKLDFDPSGASRNTALLGVLPSTRSILSAAEEARLASRKRFPNLKRLHNNDGDAYRHALFSYKLTKMIGAFHAKRFLDGHEISNRNADPGERLMDLFNNNVGRRLAMDPKNRNRADDEVVMEAFRRGELQTEVFKMLPSPSGTLRRQHSPFGGSIIRE